MTPGSNGLASLLGVYTENEAQGAITNGTRVVKVNSEPGDAHQNGALGTVLGSIGPHEVPGFPGIRYAYFIHWDGLDIAVGTIDLKVKVADG